MDECNSDANPPSSGLGTSNVQHQWSKVFEALKVKKIVGMQLHLKIKKFIKDEASSS